jgi:hypothetical protein
MLFTRIDTQYTENLDTGDMDMVVQEMDLESEKRHQDVPLEGGLDLRQAAQHDGHPHHRHRPMRRRRG